MHNIERIYKDVLVVGGGGAGAMAAMWAAKTVDSVGVIEKGIFGNSGCTPMAGFSVCAAAGIADPRDTPEVHFYDTLKSGQYINNQTLVKNYTEEAVDRIWELMSHGCKLSMENGKPHQAQMPGHTYPRAFHYERRTGPMVMRSLANATRKTPGVEVFKETIMADLVVNEQGLHHLITINWADSSIRVFSAKVIVIATGSAAQVFRNTTSSLDNTGDGLSLLYRAGATLSDMEFVQFYPTTQCHPKLLGMGPTCPAFLRLNTGARLQNGNNESFMDAIMPDWRFKATRDFLSRSIYREVAENRGTPHGGVWIDLLHLDADTIKEKFAISNYYTKALRSGVDLTKDRVETTVAAHYFMGGVTVTAEGATNLPGVYAAGEAVAGYHGANRLGGNAVSEILVSGQRAGHYAGMAACDRKAQGDHDELAQRIGALQTRMNAWECNVDGEKPALLKKELKNIMWERAGVVRTGDNLEQGLKELDILEQKSKSLHINSRKTCNRELLDALEIGYMLDVSRLIMLSALKRTESRGAHFRDDFPEQDNANWLANIHVTQGDSTPTLAVSPVELLYAKPEA